MVMMETNRELRPARSFSGKLLRKSLATFLEVRMERNIMSPVTEKHSPTREARANTSNAATGDISSCGKGNTGDESRHHRARFRCILQPLASLLDELLNNLGLPIFDRHKQHILIL
ncbi:hypothetical protein Ahy_B07g088269 [Arachis hypogaea]|uniref:Uncharacterized protein n=1 Tax=Arachis hypogaea TaxID=3818 RepID=A0A444YE48_ARAHY|nr:hypothetical protein Ahy_B07g088269 [Arachis hypogaea]